MEVGVVLWQQMVKKEKKCGGGGKIENDKSNQLNKMADPLENVRSVVNCII